MKRDMSYSIGRKITVDKLCREIRIQSPNVLARRYTGFNTMTGDNEIWELIKLNKNPLKNLMQRTTP